MGAERERDSEIRGKHRFDSGTGTKQRGFQCTSHHRRGNGKGGDLAMNRDGEREQDQPEEWPVDPECIP
jgi:hypothetical protein